MNLIKFLKNNRNVSRNLQREWNKTLIKKPELVNPDQWPGGLKRLHEVQKEVQSQILKNLRSDYPHNIAKKFITKTDEIGYQYQTDEYFVINIFDKLGDLFRKKQKYKIKESVLKVVHRKFD